MNSMLPIISPDSISLIATYRCTAQCIDCCFQCSPQKAQHLSIEQMKSIIDESVIQFPTIRMVIITGGECFTLGNDLNSIIKHIHSRKLKCRVVTNGYWAYSIEHSRQVIKHLIEDGLTEINFSTGDCHQQWVPLDFVINGIIAAIEQNVYTVVNVETHECFSFTANQLYTHPRLQPYAKSPYLKILPGIWISSRSPQVSKSTGKHNVHTCQRCKQLFKVLTITPDSELVCCCGLTITTHSFLKIGTVSDGNIKQLWDSQFTDFLKIWLYTEGPEKIMQYVNDINPRLILPNMEQLHICEICHYILTNVDIIEVLRSTYNQVLPRVLLEYTMLTTTKNKLL